jgi:hypothetical protein
VDEVIYLEVLEGEAVHARHRLERFPVSVGRGYGNEIILDDPKVSAQHLRIERAEDGRLVLRDVGSHNGTFRVEPWARLAELVVEDDVRVAVGDTVLRLRTPRHMVEPTLVGTAPADPRTRLFERPFAFPALLAVAVAWSLLSEYLSSYGKTDWGALAYAVLVPVLVALGWTCGWSLVSKLVRRQAWFSAHGGIGSLGLLGAQAVPQGLVLLTFSLSLGRWVQWVSTVALWVWLGCVLFWHLRYVTRWESRRLAAVLASALAALGVLSQAQELLGPEEFRPVPVYEPTLLPPALRLAPARPVDSFFRDTEALQHEVDALAAEPLAP